MTSLSSTIGAAGISLSLMYSTSANAPQQPAAPAWQKPLHSLIADKTIRNASEQCVPMPQLSQAPEGYAKERAHQLQSILQRTRLTAKLSDTFNASGGILCFIDFDKEYGLTSMSNAGGVYYHENKAIILNTNPKFGFGCHVMLSIHEMHHNAQDEAGVGFIENLVRKDMESYTLIIESDAHAVETLGSWMLAQPAYSREIYTGAQDCLSVSRPGVEYKAKGLDLLKSIAATHPEWVDNGQAALQIYDYISKDSDFQDNYTTFSLHSAYDCENNEQYCMQPIHRIADMNIDFSRLGKIHYPHDYRTLPKQPMLVPGS